MHRSRAGGIAVGLLVWAAFAVAAVSAAAPRGNSQGLALLARVHRAYVTAPAVSVSARIGSQPSRFTIILRSGIVTAEQFQFGNGANALILVASDSTTDLRPPAAELLLAKSPGHAVARLDRLALPRCA